MFALRSNGKAREGNMDMLWMLLEALDPGRFFDRIFKMSSLPSQQGSPGQGARTQEFGPGFPPLP